MPEKSTFITSKMRTRYRSISAGRVRMMIFLSAVIFFSGTNRWIPPKKIPLTVMTFNIRYPNERDSVNYWPNRKMMVASMIRFHRAELIGIQEAFRSQLDDLEKLMPEYAWTGVCRTDGSANPSPDNEFSAILYRRDRFQLLESKTFWLSEQPEKIGLKGWDAALPRIVTWARFKDLKNGNTFFHFNTHFDHQGEKARRESAFLLLQKVHAISGNHPAFVTGDFNANPGDPPMLVLTDPENPLHLLDAFHLSEMPHHGPDGTWTDSFRKPGVPGQRIDYVLVKKGIKVLRHGILAESWSGRLPSDHLPVLAELSISE